MLISASKTVRRPSPVQACKRPLPPGFRCPRPVRNREFEALFESDIPLARLSRPLQYTVVEVFINDRAYCSQFEEAFDAFNRHRTDVSLFRVHHPGTIEMGVTGQSDHDRRQQLATLNARMDSYDVCATPHIEVYGPDRELLAKDTCGARDGTAFAWQWIKLETGIVSTLPLNGFWSLTESKPSVNFVTFFLAIELAYLLLVSIQGALDVNKNWWDFELGDQELHRRHLPVARAKAGRTRSTWVHRVQARQGPSRYGPRLMMGGNHASCSQATTWRYTSA